MSSSDVPDLSSEAWVKSGGATNSARFLMPDAERELTYHEVAGLAIFEGDIVLGTIERIEKARKARTLIPQGMGINDPTFLWPDGVIPYQVDEIYKPQRVAEAIDHFHTKTKLTFVLRDGLNAVRYKNHIQFEDHQENWSDVGMRGRKQIISISAKAPCGIIVHEICHAVGFWHEQARIDRDEYVTIVKDNIRDGYEDQFNQRFDDGIDIGRYDYGSIMHYPANAFQKFNGPTIIPKGGQQIGQRAGLSTDDINAIAKLYPKQHT